MKCPKCASENTQRLEVIFNGGTQTSTSSSVSVGAAMRGGGFGAFTSSSGVSQTTLAQNVAPPQPQKESSVSKLCGFMVLFGIFPVLIGFSKSDGFLVVFGAILIGLFSIPIIKDAKKRKVYNRDVLPGLYQQWMDSWSCHKCGTIYHQP